MPSSSVDRRLLGKFLLALIVGSLQCLIVLAAPFYSHSNGYPVDRYYYNAPTQSDSWTQASQNGYYYPDPSNSIAPVSVQRANVHGYGAPGYANYYGMPGYADYRTPQDNRYNWNDPYIRRQWKNYYQGYYYPSASAGSWNGRRDGSTYYMKRRQDSPDTTTLRTITTPTTARPTVRRMKKLFVPNVWG